MSVVLVTVVKWTTHPDFLFWVRLPAGIRPSKRRSCGCVKKGHKP